MRNILVLLTLTSILAICGCQEAQTKYHVLKTAGTNGVIVDASNNDIKPKMRLDIYDVGEDGIEVPVGRIAITQTTSNYSIGTLIYSNDGSGHKPLINEISPGMICRKTTKDVLKAEKKAYKYQKKALKRQYKLEKKQYKIIKVKGKGEVYKSMGKTVQDANEISSIKAGLIKVDKK